MIEDVARDAAEAINQIGRFVASPVGSSDVQIQDLADACDAIVRIFADERIAAPQNRLAIVAAADRLRDSLRASDEQPVRDNVKDLLNLLGFREPEP